LNELDNLIRNKARQWPTVTPKLKVLILRKPLHP